MCGRINMGLDPTDLVDELDIEHVAYVHRELYNVPPGGTLPIIVDRPDADGTLTRRLEPARWGLVPGWAKDVRIGFRAFNARSETVRTKPMFRSAFARQRAVIPVPAYYEWVAGADGKEPWMMRSADRDVLFMAGLYEFKRLTDEERAASGDDPTVASGWLVSTTILTTEARGHLSAVHDRMPVMLEPPILREWIAHDADAGHAAGVLDHVLDAFDPNAVERVRVGTDIGNVRNQGAHLAEPLGDVVGGHRSE